MFCGCVLWDDLIGFYWRFFHDSVRWCNIHSMLYVYLGCLEFLAVIGAEWATWLLYWMFGEVMSFESVWVFPGPALGPADANGCFMTVALGALCDAVLVRLQVVFWEFCGVLWSGMARGALAGEWRDFADRPLGVAVVIGISWGRTWVVVVMEREALGPCFGVLKVVWL